MIRARTGTIEQLRVGNIRAKDLKVLISPAMGNLDVLGMNFLSELASWRVEGRTLVMIPKSTSSNSK
jgi:aspartyl protease family protein